MKLPENDGPDCALIVIVPRHVLETCSPVATWVTVIDIQAELE